MGERTKSRWIGLLLLGLLAGCVAVPVPVEEPLAPVGVAGDGDWPSEVETEGAALTLKPVGAEGEDGERAWLRRELALILQEFGESRDAEIPEDFLEEVEKGVERFVTEQGMGSWLRLAMARMDRYMPSLQGIFAERDMPESFFYLALVESAFNPGAVSKAGPAGLWQFEPGTGRKYGLVPTGKVDPRKDVMKSSLAARDYLHDLLMSLGESSSMLLAMAAYNVGEGRLQSLMGHLGEGEARNFWSLFHKGLLPRHTHALIIKVLSAAVIGHNRERFGFAAGEMPEITARLVFYRSVEVASLLAVGGWSREAWARLNPDLAQETVLTPEAGGLELAVPRKVAHRLLADEAFIPALTPPSP